MQSFVSSVDPAKHLLGWKYQDVELLARLEDALNRHWPERQK
jgi:hypothetical protein